MWQNKIEQNAQSFFYTNLLKNNLISKISFQLEPLTFNETI